MVGFFFLVGDVDYGDGGEYADDEDYGLEFDEGGSVFFFLCVGVWWPSFWGLVFVDTFIIIGIRFGVVESGGWFWVGYGLHYFVSLWVGCLSSMWGGVIWVGTF